MPQHRVHDRMDTPSVRALKDAPLWSSQCRTRWGLLPGRRRPTRWPVHADVLIGLVPAFAVTC